MDHYHSQPYSVTISEPPQTLPYESVFSEFENHEYLNSDGYYSLGQGDDEQVQFMNDQNPYSCFDQNSQDGRVPREMGEAIKVVETSERDNISCVQTWIESGIHLDPLELEGFQQSLSVPELTGHVLEMNAANSADALMQMITLPPITEEVVQNADGVGIFANDADGLLEQFELASFLQYLTDGDSGSSGLIGSDSGCHSQSQPLTHVPTAVSSPAWTLPLAPVNPTKANPPPELLDKIRSRTRNEPRRTTQLIAMSGPAKRGRSKGGAVPVRGATGGSSKVRSVLGRGGGNNFSEAQPCLQPQTLPLTEKKIIKSKKKVQHAPTNQPQSSGSPEKKIFRCKKRKATDTRVQDQAVPEKVQIVDFDPASSKHTVSLLPVTGTCTVSADTTGSLLHASPVQPGMTSIFLLPSTRPPVPTKSAISLLSASPRPPVPAKSAGSLLYASPGTPVQAKSAGSLSASPGTPVQTKSAGSLLSASPRPPVPAKSAGSLLSASPGTPVQAKSASSLLSASPGTPVQAKSAGSLLSASPRPPVPAKSAGSLLSASPGTPVQAKSASRLLSASPGTHVQAKSAGSLLSASHGTTVQAKSAGSLSASPGTTVQAKSAGSLLSASPGTPAQAKSANSLLSASPGTPVQAKLAGSLLSASPRPPVPAKSAISLLSASPGTPVQAKSASSLLSASPGTPVQAKSAGSLLSASPRPPVPAKSAGSLLSASPGTTVQAKSAGSLLSASPGTPVQAKSASSLLSASPGTHVQAKSAGSLLSASPRPPVPAKSAGSLLSASPRPPVPAKSAGSLLSASPGTLVQAKSAGSLSASPGTPVQAKSAGSLSASPGTPVQARPTVNLCASAAHVNKPIINALNTPVQCIDQPVVNKRRASVAVSSASKNVGSVMPHDQSFALISSGPKLDDHGVRIEQNSSALMNVGSSSALISSGPKLVNHEVEIEQTSSALMNVGSSSALISSGPKLVNHEVEIEQTSSALMNVGSSSALISSGPKLVNHEVEIEETSSALMNVGSSSALISSGPKLVNHEVEIEQTSFALMNVGSSSALISSGPKLVNHEVEIEQTSSASMNVGSAVPSDVQASLASNIAVRVKESEQKNVAEEMPYIIFRRGTMPPTATAEIQESILDHDYLNDCARRVIVENIDIKPSQRTQPPPSLHVGMSSMDQSLSVYSEGSSADNDRTRKAAVSSPDIFQNFSVSSRQSSCTGQEHGNSAPCKMNQQNSRFAVSHGIPVKIIVDTETNTRTATSPARIKKEEDHLDEVRKMVAEIQCTQVCPEKLFLKVNEYILKANQTLAEKIHMAEKMDPITQPHDKNIGVLSSSQPSCPAQANSPKNDALGAEASSCTTPFSFPLQSVPQTVSTSTTAGNTQRSLSQDLQKENRCHDAGRRSRTQSSPKSTNVSSVKHGRENATLCERVAGPVLTESLPNLASNNIAAEVVSEDRSSALPPQLEIAESHDSFRTIEDCNARESWEEMAAAELSRLSCMISKVPGHPEAERCHLLSVENNPFQREFRQTKGMTTDRRNKSANTQSANIGGFSKLPSYIEASNPSIQRHSGRKELRAEDIETMSVNDCIPLDSSAFDNFAPQGFNKLPSYATNPTNSMLFDEVKDFSFPRFEDLKSAEKETLRGTAILNSSSSSSECSGSNPLPTDSSQRRSRSRVLNHGCRSDSPGPSRSVSSRSRSRSRSPSPSIRSRHSRRRSRSPYDGDASRSSNKHMKVRNMQKQRKVVYVGGIPKDYKSQDLRNDFKRYGLILRVTTHFREDQDSYGFVYFSKTEDAHLAIEMGDKDPNLRRFQLSYGGRRQFCPDEYADLDGNRAIEEEFSLGNPRPKKDDFEALLRKFKRDQNH